MYETLPEQALLQSPRRRVVLASIGLAGLGAAARAQPVRAAAASVPQSVVRLDAAAMQLFDAAEAGDWKAARQALDTAQAAGAAVGDLEGTYTDAGGTLERFFEVRNNLGADLVEAGTALSARDRRWLVASADRIAERAGELSLPFAQRGDATAPRILSLLFLARRMRRALVWEDSVGFAVARDDFRRTWKQLRGELGGDVRPEKLHALDEALQRVSVSKSRADLRVLYAAVQALRSSAG